MIVDIIVEYGQSADDENGLTGNLWARQEGGRSAASLMSGHLPAKEGEALREQANRVFEALSDSGEFNGNDSGEFNGKLVDFIKGQME